MKHGKTSPRWRTTGDAGIYERHETGCPANDGKRCRNCRRTYRAEYRGEWSRTSSDRNEIVGWRADRKRGIETKTLAAPTRDGLTVRELIERFLDGAKDGSIGTRNGGRYTRNTIKSYRSAAEHVYRFDVASESAASVDDVEWQAFIDRLHGQGLKTNTIKVIRALVGASYRWASSPRRRILATNPMRGLELPAKDEGKRDRIALVEEADTLLSVLDSDDADGWGVAFYAGLRKSEIEALDWPDVDFRENTIRVRKAKWSEDGRKVPMADPLRVILREAWLRAGRPEVGPVIRGRRGARWSSVASWERATKRWADADLAPIGFHEARHTYISWLVASGHDIESVMVYAGHEAITTTRRYMKMYPGHERRSVDRLNAFLVARP